MHASPLALLAVFAGITATAAKVDVGGPHYAPDFDKRDLLPRPRTMGNDHSLHRRHHAKAETKRKVKSNKKNKKRNSCKASKGSYASTAAAADKVQATSTAAASVAASTTASAAASVGSSVSNALSDITAFTGEQTDAIGSWFRTDSSSDSTNGRSWCQLNYQDSWMGTAIDVDTMISSMDGDATAAMKAYCGLEIKVTYNGNTNLVYVVDGFDSEWVRTPASMDLTIAAFTAIYGSFDDNKDTVAENMSWEFTGNRNSAYAYDAST